MCKIILNKETWQFKKERKKESSGEWGGFDQEGRRNFFIHEPRWHIRVPPLGVGAYPDSFGKLSKNMDSFSRTKYIRKYRKLDIDM